MPPKKPAQAKRALPADKSGVTGAPPAKRQATRKTVKNQRNKANQEEIEMTDKTPKAKVITIDDDDDEDSVQECVKPKTKPSSESKPKPEHESKSTVACVKPLAPPGKDFPKFSDGDVVIMLGPKKFYQLHSSVLRRASPWFDQTLRLNMIEPGPDKAAELLGKYGLAARYELNYGPDNTLDVLSRKTFTFDKKHDPSAGPKKATQPQTIVKSPKEALVAHKSPSPPTPQSASSSNEGNTPERVVIEIEEDSLDGRPAQVVEKKAVNSKSSTKISSGAPVKATEQERSIKSEQDTDDVSMSGMVQVDVLEVTKGRRPEEGGERNSADEQGSSSGENVTKATPDINNAKAAEIFNEENNAGPEIETPSLSPPSDLAGGTSPVDERSEFSDATPDVGTGYITKPDENALTIEKVMPDGDVTMTNGSATINTDAKQGTFERDSTEIMDIKNEDIPDAPASSQIGEAHEQNQLPGPISPATHKSHAIKEEDSTASTGSGAVGDDIDTKEEASDIFLPGSRVEAEPAVKGQEPAAEPASVQAIIEVKIENKATPSSPSRDDTPNFKEEPSSVSSFEQAKEQEASSEKQRINDSDQANINEVKEQENTDAAEVPRSDLEEHIIKNDAAGVSMPLGIPQGDGGYDEPPSTSNTPLRFSCPRVTRKISSIKNDNRGPPSSIVTGASFDNAEEPALTANAGQPTANKSKSVPAIASNGNQHISFGVAQLDASKEQSLDPAPIDPNHQANNEESAPTAEPRKPSVEIMQAYNNLFLTFYSRPPRIDNQNIKTALEQSELLINVARLYGSIPIVRPYINNALMHFGRELYIAVMADAPRWILLSVYLESAPIFREGIVHVLGNYPIWPWPTLKPDDLFTQVVELLEQKMETHLALKATVNESLFLNTVNGVGLFSRPINTDILDTWFVVQSWSHWFTHSMAQAKKATDDGQKCSLGKVYRDLYKGGEAYLPTILVLDTLEAFRGRKLSNKSKREEIDRVLKTLKDFAQKQVRELCVNHSALSPEEDGIDYLTCFKVEDRELPWVKSAGN